MHDDKDAWRMECKCDRISQAQQNAGGYVALRDEIEFVSNLS
jgi:hypothetical protein